MRNGSLVVERQSRRCASRNLLSHPPTAPRMIVVRPVASNKPSSKQQPSPKQAWRTAKKKKVSSKIAILSSVSPTIPTPPPPSSLFSLPSWVPPAYRGVVPSQDNEGRKKYDRNQRSATGRFEKKRHFEKERRPFVLRRSQSEITELEDQERALTAKRKREEQLISLFQDLVRLSSQYRTQFQKGDISLLPYDSLRDLPLGKFLEKRIVAALKGIHEPDAPIDWKQIQKTEEDFRSLCRVLQYMCSISCSLTNVSQYGNNTDSRKYVDLAELLFLQLVQLAQGRSLLVESTRKWSNTLKAIQPANTTYNGYGDKATQSAIGGWFSRFVGNFVPYIKITVPEEKPVTVSERDASTTVLDEPFSIPNQEDSDLHSPKRLFRRVMSCIASTVRKSAVDELNGETSEGYKAAKETAKNPVEQQAYEATARRMLDLLDRMPSSWTPDTEAIRYIMEMLCRSGTLQSARMCHVVFQRHTCSQYRLQFSLVLEAYLEATMRETDKEKLAVLVEEVLNVLYMQWDASLPKHRLDRILQCSITLNCMSVAGVGVVPGMCERGGSMAKRALGRQVFSQLKEEMRAEKPRVDPQTLPVINYLAQLYASSGDDVQVGMAKQMLNYMTQHDSYGVGRFMVFPNVDTCNAVLLALIQRYEGKSVNEKDMKAAQVDFDFARGVLEYMYKRSEVECWPNSTTLALMFRFTDARNPADIGNIAEDLLSMIEARQFLSQSKDTAKITLSTYHRVLRYWMQAAKSPSFQSAENRDVACERAHYLLEKLEVQSMPIVLSDNFLRFTAVKNLYDINLRPMRNTYKMVLQICVDTSEPGDHEKAASIAFQVYLLMIKRGFATGMDTEKLLLTCCNRLAPESTKRKEIEEFFSLIESGRFEDNVVQSA